MGKVICQNCGVEVIIPQKSKVTTGLAIGKDLGGTFIMPTVNNTNATINTNTTMEDVTMSNATNNTNVTINPATKEANMGTEFTMEQLTQMVAQMVTTSMQNVMGVNTTPVAQASATVVPQVATRPLTPAETWAMGSKYYGTEICGFVFNPYMWRYHLVKNYKDMYEEYNTNIHKAICDSYDYSYAIKFTLDEIHRMAMLEKRDLVSYEERKHTFTLNACKEIMIDYLNALKREINRRIEMDIPYIKPGKNVYVKTFGRLGEVTEVINNHKVEKEFFPNEEYLNVMSNLDDSIGAIEDVRNSWMKEDGFRKLEKAISGIEVNHIVKHHKLSNAFKDAYIRAGAYYTMKAMIAFEGYAFKGEVAREGLVALRNALDEELEGYKYHAMVKEMRDDLR